VLKKIKPALKYIYHLPKLCLAAARYTLAGSEPEFLPPILIDRLKDSFAPIGNYGYDDESLKNRGKERAQIVLDSLNGRKVSSSLELGCMDAMTSVALAANGIKTCGLDIENKLDKRAIDAGVTFYSAPAEKIPAPDESFDLVFSFNAMEHFADPRKVIKEIYRVLKPGGYFYLDFDPLYYSPRGLHAYRKINIPYCQIIFNMADLENFANVNNLNWGELPYVNKYSLDDFHLIFSEMKNKFELIKKDEGQDLAALALIIKYPACFKKTKLPFYNFITSRIKLLAIKK
jgi:SAM-dependent methyltransferase